MKHAEHFLSRLERLPPGEVDLALELYRDPELIRALLANAAVPEQAERVAISLDDPTLGPFLIVTRDGHFVTCLGRGMSAGGRTVVSRAQLDAASRKIDRLRSKLSLEATLHSGGGRPTTRLLRRLFVGSESVSREEFLAVAAWEPLLGPVFLELYTGMSAEVLQQGPVLRRLRARGDRADEALHTHWNLLHATGHMALLGAAAREKEGYESLTAGHDQARSAFSWALTGTGVIAFILKGAWAAGRVGKLLLPDYRRALVEDVALFELFDTLFALIAIGSRARGARAEIQKALRSAPGVARTPEAQRLRAQAPREVELSCGVAAELLDLSPEELETSLLKLGAALFEPGAEIDEPHRAELQRTLPLMAWTDGITDGKKLTQSMCLVAAVARTSILLCATETSQWVDDGLDDLGTAVISLTGHGDRLRMHCLLAYVICKPTKLGISFTWEGAWEFDPVSGTGRVRLGRDGRLRGVIKIKNGDESTFIAERSPAPEELIPAAPSYRDKWRRRW